MAPRKSPLSRRQREVLTLVANGNNADQIAAWLWVTRDTVNTTLQYAYRNLGVHDRAHAVAVALRLGLIDIEAVAVPERFTRKSQQAQEGPSAPASRPRSASVDSGASGLKSASEVHSPTARPKNHSKAA